MKGVFFLKGREHILLKKRVLFERRLKEKGHCDIFVNVFVKVSFLRKFVDLFVCGSQEAEEFY